MSATIPHNAYTDTPQPRHRFLLAGFQFFFWLLFHPSAWRNHISRVDPELRPDFSLYELTPSQWRNPTLLRLLFSLGTACTLSAGLLGGLNLLVLGASQGSILAGTVVSAAIGLFLVLTVSYGMGVTMGSVAGVAASFPIMTFIMVPQIQFNILSILGIGCVVGVLASLFGSVVASTTREGETRLTGRQGGPVVIGFAIGGLSLAAMSTAAFIMESPVAVGVVSGLLFGLTAGMAVRPSRGWKRSLAVGITGGLALGPSFGTMFGITSGKMSLEPVMHFAP